MLICNMETKASANIQLYLSKASRSKKLQCMFKPMNAMLSNIRLSAQENIYIKNVKNVSNIKSMTPKQAMIYVKEPCNSRLRIFFS